MRPKKVLLGAFSLVFFLLCLQGGALLARTFFSEWGICNTAGPFGIAAPFWLWIIFFLLAAAFFLVQWWREPAFLPALFWLLLLAAGGSNMLERSFFHCVFDFLRFPFGPFFNLADTALSLSVVFLWWREIRRKA